MLDTTLIHGASEPLENDVIRPMKEKLLTGIQLQFAAKPIMVKLAGILDEAICLAVSSGEQMLVVDMVPSSRPNEISSIVGRRFPQTLSAGDDGFAEDIPADCYPAEPAGENQPINSRMIKVPLWNGQQTVCGWLCLLGMVERMTPKRLRELLPVLRKEGESLSVLLSKGWP